MIIGLTWMPASGKSTVVFMFRQFNILCIIGIPKINSFGSSRVQGSFFTSYATT